MYVDLKGEIWNIQGLGLKNQVLFNINILAKTLQKHVPNAPSRQEYQK
jgi:hypothetical protein